MARKIRPARVDQPIRESDCRVVRGRTVSGHLHGRRIAIMLSVFATCIAAATAQQRTWTDHTGKFSVEAELVKTGQDDVSLRISNGKVIRVPIAKLSEADRRYLRLSAQESIHQPVQPAPQVIASWKKAGAQLGWVSQGIDLVFDGWWPREKPRAGDLPTFFFGRFATGELDGLPAPEIPFGLSLFGSATDADLKALARLPQLQSLQLTGAEVTDAGLKQLAGLTQLRSLDLNAIIDGNTELSGPTVEIGSCRRGPILQERPGA